MSRPTFVKLAELTGVTLLLTVLSGKWIQAKQRKCKKRPVGQVGIRCRPSVSAAWASARVDENAAGPEDGIAIIRAAVMVGGDILRHRRRVRPYTNEDVVGEASSVRAGGHRHEFGVQHRQGKMEGLNSVRRRIRAVAEPSLKMLRRDRIDFICSYSIAGRSGCARSRIPSPVPSRSPPRHVKALRAVRRPVAQPISGAAQRGSAVAALRASLHHGWRDEPEREIPATLGGTTASDCAVQPSVRVFGRPIYYQNDGRTDGFGQCRCRAFNEESRRRTCLSRKWLKTFAARKSNAKRRSPCLAARAKEEREAGRCADSGDTKRTPARGRTSAPKTFV